MRSPAQPPRSERLPSFIGNTSILPPTPRPAPSAITGKRSMRCCGVGQDSQRRGCRRSPSSNVGSGLATTCEQPGRKVTVGKAIQRKQSRRVDSTTLSRLSDRSSSLVFIVGSFSSIRLPQWLVYRLKQSLCVFLAAKTSDAL
jgi:hypothetical protein